MTKYVSNTTLTSFVSPSVARKIAKIARFTQAAFLRKQTRHNGRMIYADINTPIAARYLPIFLLLFFFSSWPSRGYFAPTVTKKQGGPYGKTQYHPVMTAPYFSKVPLRGWRVARVPLATPTYRVTRSVLSLSFSLFPPTRYTHQSPAF